MKIIQIPQNSEEWKAWRSLGIGASDVPIIMGESPWTTRLQLWQQKKGLATRSATNIYQIKAMERGHKLEPEARARFEKRLGKAFPAVSCEHPYVSFIRASLDGFNADENANLEIKCPGKLDHATALSGNVPTKYMPQLQAQMLVSGASKTYYFSWDGLDSDKTIEVLPNKAYQGRMLMEILDFWHCVVTGKEPL